MKKFSKLIAVVLAIAVIICPMMSVVSHATTTNGYKIEANPNDANELMLTITSTDGFVAYDATVTFNSANAFQSTYGTGGTDEYYNGLKLKSYEVKGGVANPNNAPTISSHMTSDTTLKLIVIKDNFGTEDLYTKLVIGIRVAAGSTATLTKIQAADQGTVAEDSTLLTFPAANASTGEIDQTDEYAKENATITVHTHDLTPVSAKDATCTEPGNTAYYTCSCGKIFSDSEGTDETTLQAVTIPATGHTPVTDEAVAPTCTETGLTAGSHCSVCGAVITAQEEVPANGHTPVTDEAVAPTCTETGLTAGSHCSVCGTVLVAQEEVSANGHTPVTDEAVAPTCTKTGLTVGSHCSACNTVLVAQTVVPALGHAYTYHKNGDGTHTVGCERCDYSAQETCDTNGTDGVCSKCGYKATTEAVEDSTLVFVQISPSYMATGIQMNFRVANTVLSKYADMEVVIIPDKYDRTTLNRVANPSEIVTRKSALAAAGSSRKQYTYTDIMLYELGLDINYMLRAYDASGNFVAYSPVYTISAETWLRERLASGSVAAAAKQMYMDTLVVCDEVMAGVAANYPSSDLATDYATHRVVDDLDTSIASSSISTCNTVDTFTSNSAQFTQASGATHQVRSSVAVEKVPYIQLRIADQSKVLDLNKLAVTVTYTSRDSQGDHPYEKTFTGSDFSYAGKYIQMKFAEVGLHDSNKDITFTCTYDDAEMFTWVYSIETFEYNNRNAAATGAMLTSLIKLGQSFRAYQGLD